MKANSPPAAPNAQATAQAQMGYNTQAAQATQQMNRVDQTNPFGSSTWSQSGTNPDGTPRYQQTTTLNAADQGLLDTNRGSAQALATRINAQAGNPFSLNNEETEARLLELGSKRLDPALARARTASEADLLNRGLVMGSEPYKEAMGRVGEQENDARNQLLLTGRQQAVSELLAERNQPYEELARLQGTNPQTPQFAATPQAQVASPNYEGDVNAQYQAELQAFQQKQQQQNAMLGGLFGLGGTLVGGAARQVPNMFGGWR